MKAKFVQDGTYIDYTPEADVAPGDVVVIGKIAGVANHPIKAGEIGAVAIEGVFEIEKGAGAIDAGTVVYWNADDLVATADAEGNTEIGKAVAAAAENDTAVRVKLG